MAKEKDANEELKELEGQLKYAQKLINVVQSKLNESNSLIIQLTAKLELSEEDKIGMMEQLKEMGITEKET